MVAKKNVSHLKWPTVKLVARDWRNARNSGGLKQCHEVADTDTGLWKLDTMSPPHHHSTLATALSTPCPRCGY